MSTQVAIVVPNNLALPAHLMSADIAAQVAAANAAAAGGIKSGGFPKISIEGGKFHQVDGGEQNTFMMAAVGGQPALPMMCFEAVVIAANPALVKKYYAKKWQKGDDAAPDCQSNNGVTPDAGILTPNRKPARTVRRTHGVRRSAKLPEKKPKPARTRSNSLSCPRGSKAGPSTRRSASPSPPPRLATGANTSRRSRAAAFR